MVEKHSGEIDYKSIQKFDRKTFELWPKLLSSQLIFWKSNFILENLELCIRKQFQPLRNGLAISKIELEYQIDKLGDWSFGNKPA